jgi:outer membrane protein assembly factor BamB/tetratricopeptide (TPR) repeat protein
MLRPLRMVTGAFLAALAAAGLLAVWSTPAPAQVIQIQAQPAPAPFPPGGPGGKKEAKDNEGKSNQFSAVKLIENTVYRQYVNAARDAIQDKAWDDAITILQKILDTKEDNYVQMREKDPSGREVLRWTSVKFAANNMLGSMAPEGLDVYETRYGGKALALLREAKETGDEDLLSEVAHRYFHTKAGVEANERLATMLLDRGQFFLAALRFGQMLKLSQDRYPNSPLTLFKAALSYRRAGDKEKSEAVWKKFEDKLHGKEGLQVADGMISVDRLRGFLDDDKQTVTFGLYDWPMARGDRANNAQGVGSPPLLDQPLYKRGLVMDNDPGVTEWHHDEERRVKAEVDSILNNPANPIAMPGFFPVVSGGRVVFRAYGDIRCVAVRPMEERGVKYKPGDTMWRTFGGNGSIVNLLENKDLSQSVNGWLTSYKSFPGFANLVFENTTIGAISTDRDQVYYIEDLAVPPPDHVLQVVPNFGMVQPTPTLPDKTQKLVMQNCLYAIDIKTGRLAWYLGSDADDKTKDETFADSHFLGAPISIGGKLYVLNEKNFGITGDAELRLVCIDPDPAKVSRSPKRPMIVQPIQTLGMIEQRNRVTHAVSRRINSTFLAYGEGILVCPTNAGEILGVDLMSRSLAWAYPYREAIPEEKVANPQPGFQPGFRPGMPYGMMGSIATISKWKSTPPVIANGKVIFTAPDSDSIHCINLHDGTPIWKRHKKESDVFFAGVVGDKALVVSKNQIRALRISDGDAAWKEEVINTGDYPSGMGVACNNVYYLPLKKGEILAIDVEKGAIKAHNRTKNSGASPGNLVFSEGSVLSVNALELAAYPQLLARLEVAEADLRANPNDGPKLVARGEILLADGQVQRAVDDLEKAIDRSLPADLDKRAKNLLYDALSDLLLADFDKASVRYLDLYQQLAKLGDTEREKQLRQAKVYRIIAQGREAQGNLIEAFHMYRKFGSLPIHNETRGVASLDDPSHVVPVNVWLRGRISAMFAKATPQQKIPLDRTIVEEWKAVEAKKDPDALRSFVGMFDVAFEVGREARLRLAEAIIERNDRGSFLEAELSLLQLRGEALRKEAASGGQALAGLAHLEEKRGSAEGMREAAHNYRQLAREFPKDAVRGARTGAELLDQLAADKRLLPYVEEGTGWGHAPLVARELGGVGGTINPQLFTSVLHPEGTPSPFMSGHRLQLETSAQLLVPKISLVEIATGKVRWGPLQLDKMPPNLQVSQLYNPNAFNHSLAQAGRFRFYQGAGHLVVFQVGVMVYCMDADQGRFLWNRSLIEMPPGPQSQFGQFNLDNDGNLQISWGQFNGVMVVQPSHSYVGQIGAVGPGYVALVTQNGLLVLDPIRGGELWKKSDVTAGSQVFGDDQYLCVVEAADGGVASTRVYRTGDGEPVLAAPPYTAEYQGKLRTMGRHLLTLTHKAGQPMSSIRLFDPATGRDVWSKPIDQQATIVVTDDPNLTGWIDPTGRLVALDARNGTELLSTNVAQGRLTLADVRNLREPLLVADKDRFYLALNHPVDPTVVGGGVLSNNFKQGIRSRAINGWVAAFYRADGPVQVGRKTFDAHKGELAWHSNGPVESQLLVVEQIEQMPVLLMTSRRNHLMKGGVNPRIESAVLALHKETGKTTYESGWRQGMNWQFVDLQTDARLGIVNLIGTSSSVQFHLEDGRKVEPPQGLSVTSSLAPSPSEDVTAQMRQAVILRQNIMIQQMAPPAFPLAPPAKR